ncbi:MAG: sigma 54-interacting transcriptional regulator [Acidobacteriota bacterium]|jgi:transcriptional regulator with PAS, ATPase and Fis domain|nr:sigma 54-interacting transcriptional regulator [Acidobacteriota bacterium]
MPNNTISARIDLLADPGSLQLKDRLDRIAALNTPVLLIGETGSGKDVWAEYLHAASGREPFLNLHCGDVPETLLESEWFGYRRGAFTGAERDFDGKWSVAGNGTLFLNRIDLLGPGIQAKLLRIIERRRYYPLGDVRELNVSARFLFSADADIEAQVHRGEFRADLFYRISTLSVSILPLRERPEDIRSLLAHFAWRFGVDVQLSAAGHRRLLDYPWPGNIRELENLVESARIFGGVLTDERVEHLVRDGATLLEMARAREWTLEEMEKAYILHLMRRYGRRTTVARILGISRKSLYNRLKKYESN